MSPLLSYGAYNIFYNNQRGITLKLRNGEQPFLNATHCYDLIFIPLKLHEDIPNGY